MRYVWNKAILKEWTYRNLNLRPWTCQVIHGFCESVNQTLNGKQANFVMIARKSKNHEGTRFNATGLNWRGHAATYVETECIIEYNNETYSFVSHRGSCPVMWSQKPHKDEKIVFSKAQADQ